MLVLRSSAEAKRNTMSTAKIIPNTIQVVVPEDLESAGMLMDSKKPSGRK